MMKKQLFAALALGSFLTLPAEVAEVNGQFKLDDKGEVAGWKFQSPAKTPGAMEVVPGEPNAVKITAAEKSNATFSGPGVPAKIGDKIKLSANVNPGEYAMLGLYLHNAKGGYISSLQRAVNSAPADGKVTIELTVVDPTKKGFVIAKVIPFLRVYNGRSTTFKDFALEITPVAE